MEMRDFLVAILPEQGSYCVAELTAYNQHFFLDSIDEAVAVATREAAKKRCVYFTPAAYKNKEGRAGVNGRAVKTLFVDIDVGLGKETAKYVDRKEALAALQAFTAEFGFGDPCVVSSGNGFHAYWILDQEVPVDRWRPTAERFKRLCLRKELGIDPAVTGDCARLLRVPGTFHFRDPDNVRPVRVLVEPSGTVPFDVLEAKLAQEVPDYVPAASSVLGARPDFMSASRVKLIENAVASFKRILSKTGKDVGCSQLRHYIEHAHEEGMEPLWRAMLSIAKHCEEADKATVWLSKLHPYDEERMHKKLYEIRGPYTCAKIDGINPDLCPTCPHWGKIKAPITLGNEVKEATPIALQVIDAGLEFKRPTPPRGYFYGKNGGVYFREGVGEESAEKCVVPYDVFVTSSLSHGDNHSIHVVALTQTGVREAVVPAKALVARDDTLKVLGGQLIYAIDGQDKHLYDFIKRSASELTVHTAPRKVPATYGWQEGGVFVLNGKEFTPQGEIRSIPLNNDHINLHAITTPEGSLEKWREIVKMVVDKDRMDILFAMCTGFGAPLMEWTGFGGMLVHVQSHESGTGKSMALGLASSIYGHPYEYWVTCDTSVVTTQLRMGLLHSLPIVMDEVTYKTRELNNNNPDWIGKFLLDLTIGKSKERMEASTTKERLNVVRWSTLALFGSNSSIVDLLTSRRYTTNGELQRMIEITMDDQIPMSEEDANLYGELRNNYGLAGYKFIKWIVQNQTEALQILNTTKTHLRKYFDMDSHERFWHSGISTMIAGAIIASPKYADVVELPIQRLVDEGHKWVRHMRGTVTSNKRTAADVMNAFVRENYGQFVIIRKRGTELTAALGIGEIVDESLARGAVRGRIEHGFTPGIVSIYIERATLNSHCHAMSYNSAAFKKELSKKYTVVDNIKKQLLANTKVRSIRTNVVRIDLPEDDLLVEDLDDGKETAEGTVPVGEAKAGGELLRTNPDA